MPRLPSTVFALFLATLLAACQNQTPATSQAITAEGLTRHIQTLASDAFGGRAPATPGGEKTVAYIRDAFAAMGLAPGNGDSYFQAVPLVQITADPAIELAITGPDGAALTLDYGADMIVGSRHTVEQIALENSELVFVGYGVVAPEYGWNDYAGLDVRGKTVVVLVNDPGYAGDDVELFNGRRMTYYGRWTYKYEEAARQGAAGVLVVHDTYAAGYPWEVVTGSWSGPQYDLQRADNGACYAKVEGWITTAAAEKLFALTGKDFATLKAAADQRDFTAVALGLSVSTTIHNTLHYSDSRNVIALLPGSTYPDEYIIYTAHWDHLGTDPNLPGDQIYNGAVDNATGVAALLEIAHAFTTLQQPPQRSIIFLAVTAEESGLLGSRWYAEHPVFPLAQTVGGINMDALQPYGPTRDISVIGFGNSELEDYLAVAANAQHRVLVPEDSPEKGYYYRSDHFSFAKQGVPMLYAESGIDYLEGGKTYGRAMQAKYLSERYHKPADEYGPEWNMRGMVLDAQLFFAVGQALANTHDWPQWREGVEFRAIRQASRQAAAAP